MGTYERNMKARDLEREGNLDEAIKLYEENVMKNKPGKCHFDRLAIIYRRNKQNEEEIRVLKKALWVYENVVVKENMTRIADLKHFYERLNKAEKIIGVPLTSYKIPKGPSIHQVKKPNGNISIKRIKTPKINTRTIRGKVTYLQSLDSYERSKIVYNLDLKTKISIIRKAVKQECNSLKVGYHNIFGKKYLAIKPPRFKPQPSLSFFSPHEKASIVRLYGNILGIHRASDVPMGVVYIDGIDKFVLRSIDVIY